MSLLSCPAFCQQAEPASSAPPEPEAKAFSGSSRISALLPAWRSTNRSRRARNLGIATLALAWFKGIIENRRAIFRIAVECFTKSRGSVEAEVSLDFDTGARKPSSKRSRERAAEAAVAHVPLVLLDAQKNYAAPGSTGSET